MVPSGTTVLAKHPLEGIKCQDSSGAQHRCGLATDLNGGSCPRSRHNCRWLAAMSRAVCRFLCRRLRCVVARAFANAKGGHDLFRLRSLQELLKLAVFGEDIGECLFDYIVGAGPNKGRVLIDQGSSRIR